MRQDLFTSLMIFRCFQKTLKSCGLVGVFIAGLLVLSKPEVNPLRYG